MSVESFIVLECSRQSRQRQLQAHSAACNAYSLLVASLVFSSYHLRRFPALCTPSIYLINFRCALRHDFIYSKVFFPVLCGGCHILQQHDTKQATVVVLLWCAFATKQQALMTVRQCRRLTGLNERDNSTRSGRVENSFDDIIMVSNGSIGRCNATWNSLDIAASCTTKSSRALASAPRVSHEGARRSARQCVSIEGSPLPCIL